MDDELDRLALERTGLPRPPTPIPEMEKVIKGYAASPLELALKAEFERDPGKFAMRLADLRASWMAALGKGRVKGPEAAAKDAGSERARKALLDFLDAHGVTDNGR